MEEKRELKIIKNKDGHGTMGYKIALPSKWVKQLGLDTGADNYATVILKDNSIIIKNKEDFVMENMIKELKEELLNKEVSLLDMDNTIESVTGSTTSIFENLSDCLEQNSCSYYIREDKNIVVEFKIAEGNEDRRYITVTVTDIWED